MLGRPAAARHIGRTLAVATVELTTGEGSETDAEGTACALAVATFRIVTH